MTHTLLQLLVETLRAVKPNWKFSVEAGSGRPYIEFAPLVAAFGPLRVYDDQDELTVDCRFTHFHVGELETPDQVVADTIHHLVAIFDDEIEFYTDANVGGAGPRCHRSGDVFVWSGRRLNANAQT